MRIARLSDGRRRVGGRGRGGVGKYVFGNVHERSVDGSTFDPYRETQNVALIRD